MNLSIKNAPDNVVERLRMRAARNHRSLQDKMLATLEVDGREDVRVSPTEVLSRVRALGLETDSDSVAIVRADRDGH